MATFADGKSAVPGSPDDIAFRFRAHSNQIEELIVEITRMATSVPDHNAPFICELARKWVHSTLIEDGSVFTDAPLASAQMFQALDECFVQNPYEGAGNFYERLKAQLMSGPPDARKLMAEILWGLFLFASNIRVENKRNGVLRIWGWSGDELDPTHVLLSDQALDGIGSAGMAVFTNRWRELAYIITLGGQIKRVSAAERKLVFESYDQFMEWIGTVPQQGSRQFPQMLRYMLFPERVERMSTNADRRRVLEAFGVAVQSQTRNWSDRQFDEAMLRLRREQEIRYGTTDLDFYRSPLRSNWIAQNEPDDAVVEAGEVEAGEVSEGQATYVYARAPRNIIYYGPPGTGKTWRIQKLMASYTDQPTDVDRTTWEQRLMGQFGWRAVIATALAVIGEASRVAQLESHPVVRAKALERNQDSVRPTLWSYLQSHTSRDSATVKAVDRREPFIFNKGEDSAWFLVDNWEDEDGESARLYRYWRTGPEASQQPVRRYRLVTFHPSYSYEDFVIGLRPVSQETGQTEFRPVPGVFKQLCAEARANPNQKYALFIDEINRANIAKVFGELITLVEPDKRAKYGAAGTLLGGIEVQLPGTGGETGYGEQFGVPENLDIYGTMNTADRSIALLDIALRRRFEFEEIGPDYASLDRQVDGVHLGKLLQMINDRLEYLADRDRRIGHAYFNKVTSLEDLSSTFRKQIIPLLQEFFFDDWSRIVLVLMTGDGRSAFIEEQVLDPAKLFSSDDAGSVERRRYGVTDEGRWSAEAFRALYEPSSAR